jgi:hypothetical protein
MSRKLFVMALVALGLILVASGCGAAVSGAATIVTATPRVVTETDTASPPAALPTIMPSLTPTPAPTQSGEVRLAAVGDVMLGRTVGQQILEKGPSIVFSQVQSTLDAADLRLANLECALTDLGVPEDKSYTLKAPPAAAAALQSGRFDLVSLANNHAMDYGFEGQTIHLEGCLENTLPGIIRRDGISSTAQTPDLNLDTFTEDLTEANVIDGFAFQGEILHPEQAAVLPGYSPATYLGIAAGNFQLRWVELCQRYILDKLPQTIEVGEHGLGHLSP